MTNKRFRARFRFFRNLNYCWVHTRISKKECDFYICNKILTYISVSREQIQYYIYRFIRNILNRFFLMNRSNRNFEYEI